jgi:inorganic triphosphatase YgiF
LADREIELKLSIDPGDLPLLADRLKASPRAFSGPERRWLESRYFDTADHRLARRDVSLRVRRVDGGYIQTLKTRGPGQGAHIERGEWECPVEGPAPMLERITDPAALDRLGLVLPEELACVFSTEVERGLILVEQPVPGAPPAIIEVALDAGHLVYTPPGEGAAGSTHHSAREPIAEVELELKAGPARGLYLLLRDLRRWAPLTITINSKAARGYLLASGEPPAAVWATRPALDPELTVGEALGQILENCTGQWLENIDAAANGGDIEGVHQLRVAVRRCRSALSLFSDGVGRDQRTSWNARLKTVLAVTGAARELDVFLAETLPALKAAAPHEDADLLAALEARATAERVAAYAAVRRYLAAREHADLVLDWADWVALEVWHEAAPIAGRQVLAEPVVALARRLLEKRHKRVRKLGRGFAALSDAERHEVRLALKKLRYGVEFLGSLFPGKAARRYAKAAAALQDVLGQLNDQAETRSLLVRLAATEPEHPALERGIGFVLGWQAQGLATQRTAALAAWEAFIEQRPFWQDGDDGT